MKVFLVRHGTAEHPTVDSRRPLSDEGRREVASVAETLLARGVAPVWIEHSPKARAVETAGILGEALAPDTAREVRNDLLPLGSVDNLSVELGIRRDDGMIVGHMPFLGDLACALLGPALGDYPRFPTAGVMAIERTDDGGWNRLWVIGP